MPLLSRNAARFSAVDSAEAARQLCHAYRLVTSLGSEFATDVITGLDQATMRATVTAEVARKTPLLESLASLGVSITITATAGASRLTIETFAERLRAIVHGDPADFLPLDVALEDIAVQELLLSLGDTRLDVVIVVKNEEPDRFTWVPAICVLEELTTIRGWPALARALLPSGAEVRRLVTCDTVDDVRAPAVLLHGPDRWPPVLLDDRVIVGPVGLPTPISIRPTDGSTSALATLLRRLSSAVAWAWIADRVEEAVPPRIALVDAYPSIAVELPVEDDPAAIELWTWKQAHDDALHDAALREAFAAQLRVSQRLPSAGTALANARFVASAAQRGLVAEAIQARRSARQRAADVASSVVTQVAEVRRNTLDRVVVEVSAAGAILLAQRLELGSRPVAFGLVVLVLLLLAATAAVSLSGLSAAGNRLTAFDADLPAVAEGISDDDLAHIRDLHELRAARTDLTRATKLTKVILGGAGAVITLLLLGTLIVDPNPASGTPGPAQPTPNPTVQVPGSVAPSTTRTVLATGTSVP